MNKEERLIEYINRDYSYTNYKTGVKDGTDFDKFCIRHCKDIEELLEENQKHKEVINKAIEYIKETRNHYKELLKEKYNQETSVFVNETCKKGFILCVISYLDLLELQIKDILKEVE